MSYFSYAKFGNQHRILQGKNISRDMDRLQKRRVEKGLTTSDTTAEHNKALLQKKLDRPKELLREDPRLAVKKVGRPKKNR